MVLISVLKLLYDGKLHTSKEIEEKFEVSRATVKRIIGVLRDENIKIITIRGKNGGYLLEEKEKIW